MNRAGKLLLGLAMLMSFDAGPVSHLGVLHGTR